MRAPLPTSAPARASSVAELTIRWPDEAVGRVETAKARLAGARDHLLQRPHAEIVDVVGRVLEAFRDPSTGYGVKLVRAVADAGAFSRPCIERGLSLALDAWDGDALRALVELELAPAFRAGRRLRPFAATAVVLGGGIPMPSLVACLTPLLVRSPVLAKTASRDRVTAHLLADCLRAEDAELGACLAVLDFEGDEDAALTAFLDAPCVVASGSDATISALASRLAAHQRLVAHGHRFSLAVVDAGSVDDLEGAAGAVALDAALWDQSGCLSPVCVHVVGGGPTSAARFARALSRTLAQLADEMPRSAVEPAVAARIRNERDEAAMRAAAGRDVEVFAASDSAWTVVREDEPGLRPAPLHRFVRVHPVSDLAHWAAALAPHARHLSTVGLAASPARAGRAAELAVQLGASRICELGRMQAPRLDWPHDGLNVLGSLAAWAGVEPGGGTASA